MKKKNNMIWSMIIIGIILFFTGAAVIAKKVEKPNETEELKAKVQDEVNFLDSKLVGMMHALNNIVLTNYAVEEKEITSKDQTSELEESSGLKSQGGSQSNAASDMQGESSNKEMTSGNSGNKNPENPTTINPNAMLKNDHQPDWDSLEITVEHLYASWSTILLDLYKLNSNREDILQFSQQLDPLTLAIKNKDKAEALNKLAQLYSCMVGFADSFSDDDFYNNILKTREAVLHAYAQAEQDNWEEIKVQLQNAESIYLTVVNHMDQQEKEFTINKTYINLKELQNSLSNQDKDIFYMKYKNLIEELNFLL